MLATEHYHAERECLNMFLFWIYIRDIYERERERDEGRAEEGIAYSVAGE